MFVFVSDFCYIWRMKNIIQFNISEGDGVYTASAVNAPIVTQGETFEELKANILEAVNLYTSGEDLSELGLGAHPSILTNFELTPQIHGVDA